MCTVRETVAEMVQHVVPQCAGAHPVRAGEIVTLRARVEWVGRTSLAEDAPRARACSRAWSSSWSTNSPRCRPSAMRGPC